ncbi:MAG TPA: hypothetical protein VMT99_00330 [Candidatus Paceibacterota bacterium]|nr:hypothetical protein [Candidatus Paceibacterota bacterium]
MRTTAVLLLFCAVSVMAMGQYEAMPDGIDLQKYPLLKKPLTVTEMAARGLRPVALAHTTTMLNWHEDAHRFVLETIPAGTLVLADEKGDPVYKESCGNRLASVAGAADHTTSETPPPQLTFNGRVISQAASSNGSYPAWWFFDELAWDLFRLVVFIALILGLLFIVVAIALGIAWLLRRHRHYYDDPQPASLVPTPVPAPAAAPVSPAAPSNQTVRPSVTVRPGSDGEPTRIEYGPYRRVSSSEAQHDGYRTTTVTVE